MQFKYVDRIGIELEGGWLTTPENSVTDTSVIFSSKDKEDNKITFTGESVSPPLKYENCPKWIERNLPNFVNVTCGTHVHLSLLRNDDYVKLMSRKFNDFFLDQMEKYGHNIMKFPPDHPFWERLADSNPYCAKDHRPEEQAYRTDKRGPRYSQLNYPFSLHGTIECRVFPCLNTTEDVMKAVNCFISCVENFLNSYNETNKDIQVEITEQELLEVS